MMTQVVWLSGLLAILVQGLAGAGPAAEGRRVVAWGDLRFRVSAAPRFEAGARVVGIAAGYFHSLFLQSDGSVFAWGDNRFGQTTVPEQLGRVGVVDIAAGRAQPGAAARWDCGRLGALGRAIWRPWTV